MSGPDGNDGRSRDAQWQPPQGQSAWDAQGQDRPLGQYPNTGGYPPAPGQAGNPYPQQPGAGAVPGQPGAGQPGSGQPGAGSYPPAGGYPPAGAYPSSGYPPAGAYPSSGHQPAGAYPSSGAYPQPGVYSAQIPAVGPHAGPEPANLYPPPPGWSQSSAGPGQPAPGQYRPGQSPPGRSFAQSLNPEKVLGVAVAVLGGLNFIFGFLPQYTGSQGGSRDNNLSVYAVGPGYIPILLLIAGLLALAAFMPGSERSRLAVAAVSVGGAVAAVISIGTTSPGTSSLGTGLGAILLTIFGIVQAVIAIGGYVVGAGYSPRGVGPDHAGPHVPGQPGQVGSPASPAGPTTGGGWVDPQGRLPDWPGQPSAPTGNQRSGPAEGWPVNQQPYPGQSYAGQSSVGQSSVGQSPPLGHSTEGRSSEGRSSAGLGQAAQVPPDLVKSNERPPAAR